MKNHLNFVEYYIWTHNKRSISISIYIHFTHISIHFQIKTTNLQAIILASYKRKNIAEKNQLSWQNLKSIKCFYNAKGLFYITHKAHNCSSIYVFWQNKLKFWIRLFVDIYTYITTKSRIQNYIYIYIYNTELCFFCNKQRKFRRFTKFKGKNNRALVAV